MSAHPDQPTLFTDLAPAPEPAAPPGFHFQADMVGLDEEASLVAEIARLELKPFEFRGYLGLRRVKSFGFRYDYVRHRVDAAEPLPPWLQALREKAAAFSSHRPEDFVQALVTEYAPGAPIGWHRDKPEFGQIVGVSLLSSCLFRLRRREGARWLRTSLVLPPRSAYRLTGQARHDWEHSIPPVDALRYSVTFRTRAEPV